MRKKGFFFGKNKLLVPIFRECFQFGFQILNFFNLVPVFLTRFQLSPWRHLRQFKAYLADRKVTWPTQLPSNSSRPLIVKRYSRGRKSTKEGLPICN